MKISRPLMALVLPFQLAATHAVAESGKLSVNTGAPKVERPSTPPPRIVLGDRVRVRRSASAPLIGTLVAFDSESLTLEMRNPLSIVVLSRQSLMSLEASGGSKGHGWVGAMIGAGLGISLLARGDCTRTARDGETTTTTKVRCASSIESATRPLSAVLGGGLGCLIGAAIRKEKWRPAQFDGLSVGVQSMGSGVGVSVALRF